jgi:hypothetical protein
MKKIDAKVLREKIEGLYKEVDLTQDDKKILRYERVAIANSERVRTEEEKKKASQSNKKFREENPRTEEEKYACGNNMRGKTLEEILGEERATAGKEARRQANFTQDYTGRGEKIAATRKEKGSYDGRSMRGKTHKESTKEIQGQKAKVRQDLKRSLGLGRNDSVPKDLLEKEYKKRGLL